MSRISEEIRQRDQQSEQSQVESSKRDSVFDTSDIHEEIRNSIRENLEQRAQQGEQSQVESSKEEQVFDTSALREEIRNKLRENLEQRAQQGEQSKIESSKEESVFDTSALREEIRNKLSEELRQRANEQSEQPISDTTTLQSGTGLAGLSERPEDRRPGNHLGVQGKIARGQRRVLGGKARAGSTEQVVAVAQQSPRTSKRKRGGDSFCKHIFYFTKSYGTITVERQKVYVGFLP